MENARNRNRIKRFDPVQKLFHFLLMVSFLIQGATGLARMATLLAHHFEARPTAVRVLSPGPDNEYREKNRESGEIFAEAEAEARSMGYVVDTRVVVNESVARGILSVARAEKTSAIILGHPRQVTIQEFNRVVEAVACDAPCQVIVVRLTGLLHTERILVPVIDMRNLKMLAEIVRALSGVGEHVITLLTMVQSDAFEEEVEEAEEKLLQWIEDEDLAPFVRCRAVATEARLDAIVTEAEQHDLIVMAASQTRGLRRLFIGSLAEDVAQKCRKPMLIVRG